MNQLPLGGIQLKPRSLRRWRWDAQPDPSSQPIRCKPEQWFLVRAAAQNGAGPPAIQVEFSRGDARTDARHVHLVPLDERRQADTLGWVQAPAGANRLRVRVCSPESRRAAASVLLVPIAERDPKCHPLANTPSWSSYAPPFPIDSVALPEALVEPLGPHLWELAIRPVRRPKSLRDLAAQVVGRACVIDPQWVRDLQLSLGDLERVIPATWMLLDLQTAADLLARSGRGTIETRRFECRDEIMSARVEYADVHTRGLSLMDVLPFGEREGDGKFAIRVLRAGRDWKRYADDVGFATILTSQTPWERRCNDVLSASRALGQGELVLTDLPWLVAGAHGPLLAPRLASHLLRMHLCCPIEDAAQFWVRWDDIRIVIRDIADLARRFRPLAPVRWASPTPGVAALGVSFAPEGPIRRHLLIRTGRIDAGDVAAGLPAEPIAIWMKWLARQWREQTPWARRTLDETAVTWRFETASGLKYSPSYEAAPTHYEARTTAVQLAAAGAGTPSIAGCERIETPWPEGVLGEGSIDIQVALAHALRRRLEAMSSASR